jgi:hypothetical protein
MSQKYEYKFIRLSEGWLSAKFPAADSYRDKIHEHASEGWRLVQVFAPGIGAYGSPKYFELIFERPISE